LEGFEIAFDLIQFLIEEYLFVNHPPYGYWNQDIGVSFRAFNIQKKANNSDFTGEFHPTFV